MLLHSRLTELLTYDAASGVFTWVRPTSNRVRAGQAAGVIDKSTGYLRIRIDGVLYHAHRLAWFFTHGAWPSEEIDHRNRNRSDNRLDNLRDVVHQTNMQNMSQMKTNTSGVTGVYWCSSNQRWVANIEVAGRKHCLGYFRELSDAARARRDGEVTWRPS